MILTNLKSISVTHKVQQRVDVAYMLLMLIVAFVTGIGFGSF